MSEEIEPSKEILEYVINRVSYLTIKSEFGGEWSSQCVHAKKGVLCKKCQQEQCDAAGGGMPDPKDYRWSVVKKEARE